MISLVADIQCPNCGVEYPRPSQASTATCAGCGSSVTLLDQMIDGPLVLRGELLTRGKIVIGEHGKVSANLSATEIEIRGTVEGNVTAVEKLKLGAHAKFCGNAVAAKLVVAEGANLRGKLDIGPSHCG